MTINERIFFYLEQKGIKQSELAEMLSVNKSVINSWKTRGNCPQADKLVQICELLNVSVNDILGIKNDNFSLSDEEKKIINYFRNCSAKERKILLTMCEEDSDQDEQKSSALKIS